MIESNLTVILGSTERRGTWQVPAYLDARVVLGSMQLDLRDAELGPDTTIDASVTLGSLEIIVPDDVAIEVDVDSIAGSVEHGNRDQFFALEPARRLRVIGTVRFASCEVFAAGRRGEMR
jgi:hypothetical protein